MPVPDFTTTSRPQVHHKALQTTFCGVVHSASLPQAEVHQYLGIKYASMPARFRQSQLHESYPPVTDCSQYGPISPQPTNTQSTEETLFGIPPELIPVQDLKQDEFECLNLNITTPAGLNSRSRIPVMFWIHGGGDRGSGSQWFYDGGALVSKSIAFGKPIILVTCNFRLGLLGFAANALIREDNKAAGDEGTGNFGLRDQRRAMQWVHQHIAEFGGDPTRVTIIGAGSGGADVIYHLLSENNVEAPFFSTAIVQSAVFEPVLPDVGSAGWQMSRVVSTLQLTTIEKMREVPVEKLLGLCPNLRAVDDGVFFRQGWQAYFTENHPVHASRLAPPQISSHSSSHSSSNSSLAPDFYSPSPSRKRMISKSRSKSRSRTRFIRGAQFKVDLKHQPLIIGDNCADSLLWSLPLSFWSSGGVTRRLKAICQSVSKSQAVLRAYDITSYTSEYDIMEHVLELVNDARVAWPTQCVVENALRDRGGKNVWRYVFDQEGPLRGMPHHAADLMYLFDNVPLPESAFAPMDMSFYDGQLIGSDDEDDGEVRHEVEAESPLGTPPCASPGAFSISSSFMDKCKKIDQDRASPVESDEWVTAVVDEYSYARVRDAMQERWLSFAYREAPWREDKIFVFGPEGEVGERSKDIFHGRRRKHTWKETFEGLGYQTVQKIGVELSRGPSMADGR